MCYENGPPAEKCHIHSLGKPLLSMYSLLNIVLAAENRDLILNKLAKKKYPVLN